MKRCIKCNQDDWSVCKKNIDVYDEAQLTDFVQGALDPLGWWSEPSIQGNVGRDFIYDSDDDLLFTVDYQDELFAFEDILMQSNSRDEFVKGIRNWYKAQAGL